MSSIENSLKKSVIDGIILMINEVICMEYFLVNFDMDRKKV